MSMGLRQLNHIFKTNTVLCKDTDRPTTSAALTKQYCF